MSRHPRSSELPQIRRENFWKKAHSGKLLSSARPYATATAPEKSSKQMVSSHHCTGKPATILWENLRKKGAQWKFVFQSSAVCDNFVHILFEATPFCCVGRKSNFASHWFFDHNFLTTAQVPCKEHCPLPCCLDAVIVKKKTQDGYQFTELNGVCYLWDKLPVFVPQEAIPCVIEAGACETPLSNQAVS